MNREQRGIDVWILSTPVLILDAADQTPNGSLVTIGWRNGSADESIAKAPVESDLAEIVLLLSAYAKNEKENLSNEDKKNLRKAVELFQKALAR